MSPERRYTKDSLNAFSSDHKTKKSVDKRSHECSRESTRCPEWRSSKDRNPVSFENQRNDSSYFQESKSNNGSVSKNRDSSNNFETVIANDKSKDTLLLISRNCDSSRSIESVLPNENSRNREFGINHVSGNFTHDAHSVQQDQSSEDILPRRNPDSKGQVNETALPKTVQPNQSSVCTRLSKNRDSSNSNTQAHDKTVICDSSSSKEFVASVSTCSQNMYQCPICVFNCNLAQGFTNHLIDVHNVIQVAGTFGVFYKFK